MSIDRGAIIPWKWPGRIFSEKGGVVEWLDGLPAPSDAEMEQAAVEYDKHRADTEYQRQRKDEYPPIQRLVEAMWEHLIENRPEMALELQNKRRAVKDKYPKGVE